VGIRYIGYLEHTIKICKWMKKIVMKLDEVNVLKNKEWEKSDDTLDYQATDIQLSGNKSQLLNDLRAG